MKTKILSLLVAAMIIVNVSFANDTDNFTATVQTAFTQQFQEASNINWIKTPDYYKVTFDWNGQSLTAFYDENGKSVSVSRNIQTSELPLFLQTNLSKEYKGFWISDLFEYTTVDNNKYYVTLENANKKIILESMDNNYWSVFKKSTKE
jgi:hypothetical protein